MEPTDSPRKSRGRPRAFHDKTDQNTIKSLDRALGVLDRLAEIESATLSDLAQAMGQSPATVYRVLTTFQGHGMVELEEARQTWHIGPKAFLIGSAFLRRTSVVERARPILRELMEATGETANLGIEREGHVLFVGQVETHENIRAFFPPGTLSPMHSSGIGKALLAQVPEDRLAAKLAGLPLARFTVQTLTDVEALSADLRAARARGYALDMEERNEGMRCIAAPVFDAFGAVAAGISVSGPTSRLDSARIAAVAQEVIAAAARLSAALGARVEG